MKIGILTQQLRTNYGGLLQAYALQTVLEKEGHEVSVIRREEPTAFSATNAAKAEFLAKYYIKKLLGKPNIPYVNRGQQSIIASKTNEFINKYIKHTQNIYYSSSAMKKMHRTSGYDAYIVGSDQVWRPFYSPCIANYFLDFCKNDKKIKRISYAASFGVDTWEFNKSQETECKELIKLFDAVSVREISGVDLCNKYLASEAVHVVDPTMLLDRKEYINIVKAEREEKSKGDCFYYMLNLNSQKQEFISKVEKYKGLTSFTVMPKRSVENGLDKFDNDFDDYVFPTVTQWLRAFMDAKIVLTDSFHGCVFSIIFNKNFWVVGNTRRGNARFESLLKTFGLEERLIDINDFSIINLDKEIEWGQVNNILEIKKNESLNFIRKNL